MRYLAIIMALGSASLFAQEYGRLASLAPLFKAAGVVTVPPMTEVRPVVGELSRETVKNHQKRWGEPREKKQRRPYWQRRASAKAYGIYFLKTGRGLR